MPVSAPLLPCFVPPIITLTTDFGLTDAYVGVIKGVILGIAPEARIVDISHAVEPQNILEASFLLLAAYGYFPPGSIHVAVVDPGVGTSRKPLAIRTPVCTFVGPDNGLFVPVLMAEDLSDRDGRLRPGASAVELRNPKYRLPEISSTFHGRDIFAPAAAYLANGTDLSALGPPVRQIQPGEPIEPRSDPDGVRGQIVHIDHFGNAVSNISAGSVPAGAIVSAAGQEIGPLSSTYQSGPVVALAGSTGLIEIAARNGSAQEQLGLRVGDPVQALRP